MAVNGVEIKVGQKWKTRDGETVTVLGKDNHSSFPFDGSNKQSYTVNGTVWKQKGNMDDLIELIEDAEPTAAEIAPNTEPEFTARNSYSDHMAGEAPAPNAEPPVEYAGKEPIDIDGLASETLTALGWHFNPDSQCWVADGTPSALEQHPLYTPFVDAINQAMYGKGQRHGGATVPFLDQPIFHYAKMHGRGFLTGQAAKKLEEAASTRSGDAFVTEVLGALVYAGAAIISERGAK